MLDDSFNRVLSRDILHQPATDRTAMPRILHVSDFHIRPEVMADATRLARAFLGDVVAQARETPFDLVVFSGDLTFSANNEQFELALDLLILPLFAALKLPSSAFFIAKGNHDISRDDIDPVVERGLASTLVDSDALNQFVTSGSDGFDAALKRSGNWEEFDSLLSGVARGEGLGRLGSSHTLTIGSLDIGVAILDSAWRATGTGDDGDRHKLLVGERQVERVLAGVDGADLKIAVMHHPLDWLADWDARNVQRDLRAAGVKLLLTGHTHVSSSAAIVIEDSLVVCGAGAIYQGRAPWPNSYNLIDVDESLTRVVVRARRYEEGRNVFDKDLSIAPNGQLTFAIAPDPSRAEVANISPSGTEVELFELVHAQRSIARSALENNPIFMGQRLEDNSDYLELAADFLVPPVLLDIPHSQWVMGQRNKEAERPSRANLDDLLKGDGFPVIVGEPGAGISTTLDWILLHASPNEDFVPLRVSVRELNLKSPAKLSASIDQAYSRSYPGWTRHTQDSLRLVAVEGLGDLSRQRLDDLLRLARDLPDTRWILSCSNSAVALVQEIVTEVGAPARYLYMGYFGRREVRQLVEKYRLSGGDELIDTVLGLVGHSHSSRLPFMICTLISVAAENSDLVRDGNDSEVLEKYVQILLSRDLPLASDSTGLDPNERQFLLIHLAKAMFEQHSQELDRAKAIELLRDLLDALKRQESPLRVLESLLARGLLADTFDGKVVFRQSEVLSLMLARGVLSDEDVAKVVGESLIGYPSITRHRAALSRSNKKLLTQAIAVVRGAATWEVGVDLDAFLAEAAEDGKNFSNPSPDEVDDAVARVEHRTEANEVEQEFRDLLWDTLESTTPADPTAPKPFEDLSPVGQRTRLASVISYVVKGTDLVVDSVLREEAITLAMRLWSDAAAASARNTESRDSLESSLLESGIFGESEDPDVKDLVALIARVFPLLLAHVSIRATMGNSKLSGQVRSLAKEEQFRAGNTQSLFLALFAAELRVGGWIDMVRQSWAKMRDFGLAAELIYRETYMIYAHQGVSDDDAPEIARLLAEMLAYRSKKRPDSKDIEKWSAKLQKSRLTSKFKKRMHPEELTEHGAP